MLAVPKSAAMRYIGNKTKLLSFLTQKIRLLGIEPGVAHDAFAGTAAVGRALKADGWRVNTSDLMTYSYVMQRALVTASGAQRFESLAHAIPAIRVAFSQAGRTVTSAERNGHPATRGSRATRNHARLGAIARHLSFEVPPVDGFFARNFGPVGGRMYFTDENARRIDGARTALHGWRHAGLIDDDAYYVLLAGIIEGADRVANTAGVYAAYIKHWQPNALKPFAVLAEPPVLSRLRCRAHQADAAQVAGALGAIDLLYVDPPYNTRQYAGYYHVPELIARGWFDDVVALRGKTGLISSVEQRSAWCSRRQA